MNRSVACLIGFIIATVCDVGAAQDRNVQEATATAPGDAAMDLSVPAPTAFQSGNGIGVPLASWRVTPSTPARQELQYDEFIREVMQANLDYAAQRFNVDIAKAQLAAARLLPNPTLSLDGNRDLTYHNKYGVGSDGQPALLRQVESRNVSVTQTVQLGGKRKWRIRVADETYRATAAGVDDFLRNLKIDASEAFATALATQAVANQQRIAADYLAQLSQAQETRFRAGDIGEPDLNQTRLEELQFHNDLLKAEDDAAQARLALSTFLGRDRGQTDFVVIGRLEQTPRKYDVATLLSQALQERPDLVALRHARDAAQSNVSLAKTEKIPDVDVGLSYGYNGQVVANHPTDPTPAFHQLGLSISIPLPLFNRGQEDVRIALAQSRQAQVQLDAAEMKAEVTIRTADSQYRSAVERGTAFRHELLASADSLLEARRYSYQRGANSLLELLDTLRSTNDIKKDYQDALADEAKALLELERATGVGTASF